MGPMRKDVLDKAAWAWVANTLPSEVTDEHVHTAYRILLNQCIAGNCRRNCRGNPRCLSALGQHRWLTEVVPNQSTPEPDFNSRYSDPETYVGLKNLGATCYVNSLLQLWFHNLPFRKTMYEWRPEDDPEEQMSLMMEPPSFPLTSLGHLQLLFARLQFGNQRFIDPSDFVHSLGLDTTLQQDAQEFSKLFISMLEDKLIHQSSPLVRNLISQNFMGQYSYVTRCLQCGTESSRLSTFYELDLNIQGHKTLGDSLNEFLHEENLDGANRYFCNVCREKQDAKRSIRLNSLPPMLHLQLLRFVYDRSKGHKKKLNSFIQFPEKLDMSEYLGDAPNTLVYNLSAVLVHMGSSAYSGHYVAHIRDSTTGMWNKFNDENVERMEGKNLKLGAEDDGGDFVVTAKKPRVQRPAKGFLTSKNAYMLVYSVVDESNHTVSGANSSSKFFTQVPSDVTPNGNDVEFEPRTFVIDTDALKKEMTEWKLHDHLQSLVLKYNQEFDAYLEEQQKVKDASEAHDQVQREEMRHLCLSLPTGATDQFDFVPVEWLTKCLQEGVWEATKLGPSITKDLCPHNKLDPTKVTSTKCISSVLADQFYGKSGAGLRLQAPEALCKDCVVQKCLEMRLKNKLAADAKEVTNQLKARLDETAPAYWVGKRTLKSWKRMALGSAISGPLEKTARNGNSSPLIRLETSEASPSKRSLDLRPNFAEENGRRTKRCKTESDAEQEPTVSSTQDPMIESIKKKIVTGSAISESDTESDQDPPVGSSENGQHVQSNDSASVQPMETESRGGADTPKDEIENRAKEIKTEDEEFEEDLTFNEDIICAHDQLTVDEGKRRLVSAGVWNILISYFPNVRPFSKEAPVCSECQSTALAGEAAKEMHRKAALQQKEELADLFHDRNRPLLTSRDSAIMFINNGFLVDWRKFIRDCGRCAPPDMIINSTLFCEHSGLLYHPFDDPEASTMMTAVRIEEWSALEQFYAADVEIRASKAADESRIEIHPDACGMCVERLRAERLRADMLARSHFDRAKIWVRRIDSPQGINLAVALAAAAAVPAIDPSDPEFTPHGSVSIASASSTGSSGTPGTSGGSGGSAEPGGSGTAASPAAVQNNSTPVATPAGTPAGTSVGSSEAVAASASASASSPAPATASETPENPDIRRSARSRRPRGDKELIVSSHQTLMDLKLMIFKHFQVPPFDQHLTLNGRALDDPKATLGDLNLYPEALLLLRADEPTAEEFIKSSKPEEGFKGTGLLGR